MSERKPMETISFKPGDRRVFKYPILTPHSGSPVVPVEMPQGSRALEFQYQDGVPCLWAEVDPSRATERRHFEIFGTGHLIPLDAKYVGTVQDPPFVWHLYERWPA